MDRLIFTTIKSNKNRQLPETEAYTGRWMLESWQLKVIVLLLPLQFYSQTGRE